MHARLTTLEGIPDRMDEGVRRIREDVLPQLQQTEGFKGFVALCDRHSGKLIGITMAAAEEVGDRSRSETAGAIHDTIAGVERYEVGLFEMSS